ncbi:MAG: nicotinamide-nucleotide amidohydrolase family protein, partial [Actinobacteria bacterium]|nr:nicotinamide-nucleotide amidohydrolase family protein [Actinomycetota bacterium]
MIASAVVKKLGKKKATLSVAESITGGGLAAAITEVAGSSKVFLGGVIAYADDVKIDQLKVDAKSLKKFTAVSEEVAKEMAIGARKK